MRNTLSAELDCSNTTITRQDREGKNFNYWGKKIRKFYFIVNQRLKKNPTNIDPFMYHSITCFINDFLTVKVLIFQSV